MGTVIQVETSQPRIDTPTASRWEWRTFPMVSLAGRVFELVVDSAGQPIAETYILSAATPHIVRIRHGCLEVRRLERINEYGLELWRDVLRTPFPIGLEALGVACDALDVPTPVWAPMPWNVEDLEHNLVQGLEEHLRWVSVVKRRTLLRLRECGGEYVELVVGGTHYECVAFENESPERVQAAISYLGFAAKSNINYPAALKKIVGLPKRPHAVPAGWS